MWRLCGARSRQPCASSSGIENDQQPAATSQQRHRHGLCLSSLIALLVCAQLVVSLSRTVSANLNVHGASQARHYKLTQTAASSSHARRSNSAATSPALWQTTAPASPNGAAKKLMDSSNLKLEFCDRSEEV